MNEPALAGGVCVVISVYWLLRTLQRSRHWIPAIGKVIEVDKDFDGVVTPVIKFTDNANKEWKVKSDLGISYAPYAVGDDVNIFFNPQNTKQILINSILFKYTLPVLLLLFGCLLLITGL